MESGGGGGGGGGGGIAIYAIENGVFGAARWVFAACSLFFWPFGIASRRRWLVASIKAILLLSETFKVQMIVLPLTVGSSLI